MSITAECPECGCVALDSDEVTLVVSPPESIAWYVFDCLGCARRVLHSAPGALVSALTRMHVRVSIVPCEVFERGQTVGEPPLCTDDLLDTLLWLRGCRDASDVTGDAVGVDDGSTPA